MKMNPSLSTYSFDTKNRVPVCCERRTEFWFDGVALGFGWGFVILLKRLRSLPCMLPSNHKQAELIKFVLVL